MQTGLEALYQDDLKNDDSADTEFYYSSFLPPLSDTEDDSVGSGISSTSSLNVQNTWRAADEDNEFSHKIPHITLQPPKVGQPKPAEPRKGLFSRFFRSRDMNRAKFERYAYTLRSAIESFEQNIQKNQKETKKIRKLMSKDTAKWRKFAATMMEDMARNYYENWLLLASCRVQVAARRMEVAQEWFNDAQQVLDGRNMNSFAHRWFGPDGGFIPPDNIPLPEDALEVVQSCETMEQVVSALQEQYKAKKKEAERKKSREERRVILLEILELAYETRQIARHSTKEHEFHWHPHDLQAPQQQSAQVLFNSFILDQRHSPGILIHKWYSTIEKDTSVSPQSIIEFIEYLSAHLAGFHMLERRHNQIISLFLERLIFPRILICKEIPLYTFQIQPEDLERDKKFIENCAWMCNLTQDKLGMNPMFQKRDDDGEKPFQLAIDAISEIKKKVPTDILFSILDTVRKINQCAQDYAIGDARVTADDLFPMVVYVVINSDLDDLNQRLGFLERYIKEEVKFFGEPAICLTLLQAAVAYICERSPEDFKLTSSLEDDAEGTNVATAV